MFYFWKSWKVGLVPCLGSRDLYTDRAWVAEDMVWGRRGGQGHLYEDVKEVDGRQTMGWRLRVWQEQEVVKNYKKMSNKCIIGGT